MWLVGVPITSALLLAAGSFLVVVGPGLFNIKNISVRQTVTPPETLGRTNAAVKIVSYTAMSLGAFLGGSISTSTSPSTIICVFDSLSGVH
ncbi:hypothetical protein C5C71_02215 [Rathayibacter sp. AY1C1]|nr:hypothetical protein C5C71_02215 [Rathayibacter sp. AY1C1]